MKLTISFELDLSKSFLNIKDEKDIPSSVSYITNDILQRLQQDCHKHLLKALTLEESPVKEALIKHYEHDAELCSQIFNNFSASGTMENGKKFVFTHKEPGYQEKTEIT